MKALVLTYDKQVGFADLLINCYASFGIDGRFSFFIPYNCNNSLHKGTDKIISSTRVLSKPDILSTMQSLLKDVDDEEWVFWTIDDRYPISVNRLAFTQLVDFIESQSVDGLNGFKLLHWNEELTEEKKKVEEISFFKQAPKTMFGFWHHQFLRAKVLKDVYQ